MTNSKLSAQFDGLPSEVQKRTRKVLDQLGLFGSARPSLAEAYIENIVSVVSRSAFVSDALLKVPELIDKWADQNSDLYRNLGEQGLHEAFEKDFPDIAEESELMCALRCFRREHMTRIVWRDLTDYAQLNDTLAEVSALADVCIQIALSYCEKWLVEKHGQPYSRSGEAQSLIVLGMGKLGARELNVSSDIDLIFAFPQVGETDHPRKPIENHQFFAKVGQRLIHVLDKITEDGFVFRVDMRLRPYGSSGALALNFHAFEDYFHTQGREWERFAMIKARAITGEPDDRKHLIERIVQPFVYRRYPDFSSFEALRDMKRLIMSEVHRKGGDQNIKLGSGGIREIEFIAQATQLIYGGRDSRLQDTGLQSVFETLAQQEYLPSEWVQGLLEAYCFLRDLEHAIQGYADQQTQLLPGDEGMQASVRLSLGYDSWPNLLEYLEGCRTTVNQVFDEFLREESSQSEVDKNKTELWLHLWRAEDTTDAWKSAMQNAGFEDPEGSYALLMDLRDLGRFKLMSAEARNRFEQFLPLLLQKLQDFPHPSLTLKRVLQLVKAILGRTIYLVLLNENDEALTQLVRLCSESEWFGEHLAKSPIILDDLLNPKSLYTPPKREELADELRQEMLRIPEEDLEAQMDCLRTFKQSHMLRVAASEIVGNLPVMKVSDYLTWLAEACVEASLNIAWGNLVKKHGLPSDIGEDERVDACKGFAIVAYGKLGGIELGYSSDLDMVFLYDAPDMGATNGDRSINNQLFYTRLGQRVVHILGAQTSQGKLYEVDMRLRPSGNSGMLVSSLTAFEKYQQNDAWTWEHQALVRARYIAGDADLGDKFAQVRQKVLCQTRGELELLADVTQMRDKMRLAAIDKYKSQELAEQNIKQGKGGLIDIEFITQFLTLRYAATHPELIKWTDNVRLLESLALLDEVDFELAPTIDAYRDLRSALHRKSLSGVSYPDGLIGFAEQCASVMNVWQRVFGGGLDF